MLIAEGEGGVEVVCVESEVEVEVDRRNFARSRDMDDSCCCCWLSPDIVDS